MVFALRNPFAKSSKKRRSRRSKCRGVKPLKACLAMGCKTMKRGRRTFCRRSSNRRSK
jgi:hypothetical protein